MKITKKNIKLFLDLLEGKKGCNFREDKKRGTIWNCKAGNDKSKSIAILNDMGFDYQQIFEILSVTEDNGGYCDCEILFNATDALLNKKWYD